MYIKLPKELVHPKNDLINIQNIDDNECFKRCLVKYLHPVNQKYPVKIKDIDKIEKKEFYGLRRLWL